MNRKLNIFKIGILVISGIPLLTLISSKVFSSSDIGLVVDAGSIFDKSFNESAWKGIQSVNQNVKESQDAVQAEKHTPSDLVNSYSVLVAGRKKYIVAPGFYHIAGIKSFNSEGYSKNINFILLDGIVESFNVASVIYQTAAAGFLAGYLASRYLVAKKIENPKIGTWGGGNFPGVTDFMVGLVYGIKYFNDQNNLTPVKIARFKHESQYTDSGFIPGNGVNKALYLINNGAQVLFPVAGPQVADVFNAINQNSNKDIKIIGVDSNAAIKFPNQKHFFITSVIKDLTRSVNLVYRKIKQDDNIPSDIKGLGEKTIGSLENGLTTISDNLKDGAWDEVENAHQIFQESLSLSGLATETTNSKTWIDALEIINSSLSL